MCGIVAPQHPWARTSVYVLIQDAPALPSATSDALVCIPFTCSSGPRGSARIEVAFHLDKNDLLTATALDLDNARQEEWLQHGAMMARAQDHPVA